MHEGALVMCLDTRESSQVSEKQTVVVIPWREKRERERLRDLTVKLARWQLTSFTFYP